MKYAFVKIITELFHMPPDLDWSKIIVDPPSNRRIQSGEISDLEFARLCMAMQATGKSKADILKTALVTYLRRNKEEHERSMQVLAAQRDVSVEEAISMKTREVNEK